MAGGTGQDAPDTEQAPRATPTATEPLVLDDSDYAIPDEWGLIEAYNDEESVVHHGDTLYIAGTHSLRDVADDLLIPLHLVRNSQRYQQALAALQRANGRVKYLSGHSLGGAVAAVAGGRDCWQARSAVPRLSRSANVRRAAAALGPDSQFARVS